MNTHLLIVALQLTLTLATRLSFLDHNHFQTESCFLQLHENITWYDADTSLLLSNGHISKLNDCQIASKQSVGDEVQFIKQISTDTILMCRAGELYKTDLSLSEISLVSQDNEFYNTRSLCSSTGGELITAWISNNLYTFSHSDGTTKISKYLPLTRTFVKTIGLEASDSSKATKLIFNHGNFVYMIYTGSSGEAKVARVCENDQGNYGSFSTERYGQLSCTLLEIDHTILLDAQYDPASSKLLLLTSRTPVELSGRVLCAIPIQEIDSQLDTGQFLDYDEMGRERGSSGSKMNCNAINQMNYLTQLLDLIKGSHTLLTHQKNYNSFRNTENVWYLVTDDGELDILKEKHDRSLSRIQSVQTNMSPARLLLSTSGGLTLLSRHKIAILPKFFCSHFQDPAECYQGPSCSFSEKHWNCSLAAEKKTFAEDHPGGVIRKVSLMGGCVTEITTYTASDTTVSTSIVSCPLPSLPKNVELVNQNNTCLAHLTTRCRSGADLTSGDPVRQCLPTGNWSGSSPVCTERRCPILTPSPGSHITTDQTTVGTTLQTSCTDPCHVTSAQTPLRCLETGQWNGTLPTCSSATCYPLPLPKNTVLLFDERRPKCGGQFAARCVEGTDLVYGDLVRTCRKDSSWSGQVPLCTVTECPVFPSPKNGYLSSTSKRVGSLVTATCKACHRVSGIPGMSLAASAQCLSSGRWSIDPPSCERVTCPPLSPATGVNMLSLNTSCIGLAEFQCSTGFTLHSGSTARYCQPDGKWSGSDPICVPETCPPLQFASEDRVVVQTRRERYGERSIMRCEGDSTLQSGQLELVCLSGREWSGVKPRCVANQPFRPTAGTEAPAAIASEKHYEKQNDHNVLKIVAILGWSMFTICLIFIVLVFVFLRRGRISNCQSGNCTGKASLERQVTTSTTLGLGTLDIRKSRCLELDVVTPTYPPSSNLVTPVTPTYRIYEAVTPTLSAQDSMGNGVT